MNEKSQLLSSSQKYFEENINNKNYSEKLIKSFYFKIEILPIGREYTFLGCIFFTPFISINLSLSLI